MQEEDRKKKECLYCGNFEGYYTKALRCFERTKQGYCRELDKIVNNQDSCEFWKPNRRRYLMRRRAASRALYEILTEISAIRQIMQECEDEGKNL